MGSLIIMQCLCSDLFSFRWALKGGEEAQTLSVLAPDWVEFWGERQKSGLWEESEDWVSGNLPCFVPATPWLLPHPRH